MTRRVLILLLCVGPLLGMAPRGHAQAGFVLIVNRDNPVTSLPRSQVSKLFLGKVTKWPGGQAVLPIDQVASSPTRARFSDAIHLMDTPSVKSYWQALVFSGRGEPPSERASDDEIVAFVRANPFAIGYVSTGASVKDVKVLGLSIEHR